MDTILSHFNGIHTLTLYLLKIRFKYLFFNCDSVYIKFIGHNLKVLHGHVCNC